MIRLTFQTARRTQLLPVTRAVSEAIASLPPWTGLLHIHSPHTTAAVTINENADPDVVRDITAELDKIVPWDDGYRHSEGNSAAHLKASMMGFSEQIIIEDGRPVLGIWQGVYFCEFDGPRTRNVYLKITADPA